MLNAALRINVRSLRKRQTNLRIFRFADVLETGLTIVVVHMIIIVARITTGNTSGIGAGNLYGSWNLPNLHSCRLLDVHLSC